MRFISLRSFLDSKGIKYQYTEDNDCGGIEFTRRGLAYHIWEYPEPERGASSNVRTWGRLEDYEGDYENQIIEIMKDW